MNIILNVPTTNRLSDEQKELLTDNILALLNDVRPDLVYQNIDSEIGQVELIGYIENK